MSSEVNLNRPQDESKLSVLTWKKGPLKTGKIHLVKGKWEQWFLHLFNTPGSFIDQLSLSYKTFITVDCFIYQSGMPGDVLGHTYCRR